METKLKYEELIITPELAKDILDNHENKRNRCINILNVNTYARSMKDGKWTLDGEPLIFDANGMLIDGHHRLHAVIMAGVPVEFSVIRNAQENSINFIDTGRARTAGDVLKMHNIENSRRIAGMIRKLYVLTQNRSVIASGFSHGGVQTKSNIYSLTNEECLEIYNEHPEDFKEFANYSANLRRCFRFYNVSEIGAIISFLYFELGHPKEKIYAFFNMLYQYKTEDDHPLCKEIRETITKAALNRRILSGVYKQSILAVAWNDYISGKNRKKLNIAHNNTKLVQFI